MLSLLPAEQRPAIDEASAVAHEHVGYRERGRTPPAELEGRYAGARRDVLSPLPAAGGLDRVTCAASAPAPMPVDGASRTAHSRAAAGTSNEVTHGDRF